MTWLRKVLAVIINFFISKNVINRVQGILEPYIQCNTKAKKEHPSVKTYTAKRKQPKGTDATINE